eukprot:c14831_g1_i1.p1 GENE.c14831_g1_i1~~c14831_g1_i1.p1  ORF type:complete len:424 (-),score=116.02 c14831_g1_i1:88-1359(-)
MGDPQASMQRAVVVVFALFVGSALAMTAAPKLYSSVDEAKKAAEEELKTLGEEVDSNTPAAHKAEQEALKIAANAAVDPMHEGMEGMQVDLGQVEDEHPVPKSAPVANNIPRPATQPIFVAPVRFVDTQNEQATKPQSKSSDVPLAHHNAQQKKAQFRAATFRSVSETPRNDGVPAPSHNLMSDDSLPMFGASRPSAPQVWGQMPTNTMGMFMPQQQQQQLLFQQPQFNLIAPDLSSCDPADAMCTQKQLFAHVGNSQSPVFPQLEGNVFEKLNQASTLEKVADQQAPTQMQVPQMPTFQFPQLMSQMPQMQLPQMPQLQFPQFPQMQMPQMQMPQMQFPPMQIPMMQTPFAVPQAQQPQGMFPQQMVPQMGSQQFPGMFNQPMMNNPFQFMMALPTEQQQFQQSAPATLHRAQHKDVDVDEE